MSHLPADTACSLHFVGTATTVLRLGPFTLLTDPNFLHRGQRAYLGHGLWSRRRTEPAMTVDEVPPLDAIVLSHLHGDHWDRVAHRGLDHDVPVLTTPPAARTLRRRGFGAATGLQTWQDTTFERDRHRLTVTATPGRHAVGVTRHLLPPVMGTVLDYSAGGRRVLRLYITGDTLLVDELTAIPERFPGLDVAVLHLGGTTLLGSLLVTMDARQGAALVRMLRPEVAIPVHNDDYGVFKSPLSAFLQEAESTGVGELVRVVPPGTTTELA